MQKSSGNRAHAVRAHLSRCAIAPIILKKYHLIEPLESRMLLTVFAVIGDMGESQMTRDNAAMIKSWNPAFIASVGDVNNDTDTMFDETAGLNFHDWISPYVGQYGAGSTTGNRFWPAVGNHDYLEGSLSAWRSFFTLPNNERYYSMRNADVELFMINSNEFEQDGTTSNSTQATWLKNALAASTAQWKIVMDHHPPFSSGWHGDESFINWPFQQWGATAMISGHDHDYERVMKGDFPYFINGLGGTPSRPFEGITEGSTVRWVEDYGAMRIETSPTAINFRFYARSGQLIDDYTIGTPAGRNPLISSGDSWKYLANGSNQGTAWRAPSFNDSTWSSGASELGYGDGDEDTVVGFGGNPDNKFITTYFRKSFNIADASALSDVRLSLLYDDGAVVYVNGTEVTRANMPGGTISSTTLAGDALGQPEESTFSEFAISSSLFTNGNNTIAVEVHQSDVGSSDISFDLKLSAAGVTSTAPPEAPTNPSAAGASSSSITLGWTDNSSSEFGFRIERSTDNVNFTPVVTTVPNATTYTDGGLVALTRYYYRITALSSFGASSAITTSAMTLARSTLIPIGDTWKYLDNGSNQGTAWRANGFSDTTWKSGRAQLGYGDGDEATVVGFGTSSSNKYITTYFRRTFNVADPSAIAALDLRLLRDDGAVVYLNGTEVYRANILGGAPAYNTRADVSIGEPEESTFLDAAINKNLLVAGNNTIAVEIHQADPASSDLSFDFELIASLNSAPAPTAPAAPSNLVANAASANLINLTWTDNANNETGFQIERSVNGGSFQLLASVAANVVGYSDTSAQALTSYAYRVRATNAAGNSGYSNTANNTTPASGGSATYLSDMGWASSTNGWGPAEKDKSNGSNGANDGRTMTLNGTTFAKGLGVHASSQLVFNLAGGYSQFISDVGIDDETGDGSVLFQVFADGTKIYDSGLMTQTSATKNVSLSVAGVNQLTLTVTDGGDGIDFDHADWAGARVVPVSNPNALPAPTNLKAVAAGSQINLAWIDNATNETGYRIERSTDNINFTEIGSAAANVTSFSETPTAGQMIFYRVRAANASTTSAYSNKASAAVATNGTIPAPFTTGDIGSTSLAGSSSFSNGVYTVAGSGEDIWDNADAFRYTRMQLTGDGEIVARVNSVGNTDEWAKAGVMIRSSLDANAQHASVFVTPSNGVAFQYRNTTGGDSDNAGISGSAPRWVKLTRSGNIFSAYASADGNSWTFIGSSTITMGTTVYVGLAVTAHNAGALSTATFDNVSIG